MTLMTLRLFAAAILALSLAACSGGTDDGAAAPETAAPEEQATTTATTPAGGDTFAMPQETQSTPSGLLYAVDQPGTGAEAQAGQRVTVHYTGWLTDGTKFDSSRDRGQPFDFALGQGEVIQGWDEGVAGMTVGEKRTLVVPPALGYGEQANGPIPANSTLVFKVELLGVQ